MMDISGLDMPLTWKSPTGDRLYEGKIYFMGIIDILQQYSVRKRAETAFRKVEYQGALEPSCVHPDDYASRFVSFFDEYSQRCVPSPKKETKKLPNEEEKSEIETSNHSSQDEKDDVCINTSSKVDKRYVTN